MPSKRKKNKRRMRRVQAQRRALEEQHAANPPVKASRGIAVSAPPAGTTKKAAKAPAAAPEKISQAIPVAVPIVETPKLEPKAEPVAEPIPVEVQAPESEAVLLEQTPAEVEIEVLAPVNEEAPSVEIPSEKTSTAEAAVVQEPEAKIPETEPTTKVRVPSKAPVVAPSETEIHTVDSAIITTETQQADDVCETQNEVEAEALAKKDPVTEVEVEVAVTEDIIVPEPISETSEKAVVEPLSSDQVAEAAPDEVVTETVVESVVEVITDIPEPEQATEAAVSPASPAVEEDGKEVLAEQDAAEVPAETALKTEHAPVNSVEMPVVLDTHPEAPVQEAEAPATKAKEDVAATLVDTTPVDDFVVTESVSAVEGATESTAVQQEIALMSDTLSAQTDSMDLTTSEPEPAAAPAGETVIDAAAAEPTCLDRLSEESKSEICDIQCQMQISMESVQLGSAEMPVEMVLNAHIVPEVSIEG